MRLDDVKGFVLDVDGTLVHRDGEDVHVLPGAREVLERIRASGRPLALFTNGSHIPPAGFAAGLRDAGLDVADDELLTPLTSVRTYLRAHHGATLRPVRHRCGAGVPRRERDRASPTETSASGSTPSSSRTRTPSTSPRSSAPRGRSSPARRS